MIPLKLVLIIHETPGTIYSLIPGDSISPGSVIEKLEIGKTKFLGINKSLKKILAPKEEHRCYEYENYDSQEKCYVKNVLAEEYKQFEEHILYCKKIKGLVINNKCFIPQALNILQFLNNGTQILPQCTTSDEYHCMLHTLQTFPEKRNAKCLKPCTAITIRSFSKGNY